MADQSNESSDAASVIVRDASRGIQLEALIAGAGPDVVLLPSALRGAADFALLQRALSDAGFRSVAINPRGAGRSSGPIDALTQRDIVDDVAAVIASECSSPVHLVGHALGNIVARATASYRPELVKTVTVMPCGGHSLNKFPVSDEIIAAMGRCHDLRLSDEERIDALHIAFFAPGNDPRSWLDGWWPTQPISDAVIAADPERWWRAGHAPILILQPLEDPMAPRAVGAEAAAALGERSRYVEMPRCGHAILPEQPELIAQHVMQFLRDHP